MALIVLNLLFDCEHVFEVDLCHLFHQQSILNTLSGRRLRWLGHTIRMDHRRITHQALYCEVPGFKRGPGRPRTNWRGIVKKDLRGMGLTWEEAEVAALSTDKNGVRVWPNTFTWTWDESSQVKFHQCFYSCCHGCLSIGLEMHML